MHALPKITTTRCGIVNPNFSHQTYISCDNPEIQKRQGQEHIVDNLV